MAYKIFKIDEGKDNLESRFRLVLDDENIDVIFTRKTFRSVLESLFFSSKRIGSILRLLNKNFPVSVKACRVSLEEKYNDRELVGLLRFYGFKVRKKDCRMDLFQAVKILESRGYEVFGQLEGVPYSSPVFGRN
ncbi:MAG: hypothetical protein C4560_01305 [Nitrospiraceae bacterium]|nr:MAG: hypothetical protein C4560_01305 [Nitrospiraceae bacterium]